MNFSSSILKFYKELPSKLELPEGISLIYPFDNSEVWSALEQFYSKYFNDNRKRRYIFGINPGRFGAGITGIPFTDPKILEERCGINNPWDKKHELSSIFVYDFIDRLGGAEEFYSNFMISSLCPLGFIKDKKNYNYYDDKELYDSVEGFIIDSIQKQLNISCHRDIAFSLGKGKNFKVFENLNKRFGWFKKIQSLPHPRWVMQYQRKNYELHMDNLVVRLESSLS